MSEFQSAPNGNLTRRSSSPDTRYQRYRTVVETIQAQAKPFDVEAVREKCPQETKGFLTRILNELVAQGYLLRDHDISGRFEWNQDRMPFQAERWLDEKIYGNQVKETPQQDRPRERLLAIGPEQLKLSELLAILIRSGRPGESAVMAGEKVARKFANRLGDLPAAGRGELKSISPAVEKTAFCQIMAGIELGRRVAAVSHRQRITQITGSADAIRFCQQHFSRLIADGRQEEFHIVTLDTKHQVIDSHQITVGTLDASLVHPREVFRAAIRDAAASIILVHNHPSGDPTPSREDIAVTRRLESAGELIGIEILDHIILGQTQISLREHELEG